MALFRTVASLVLLLSCAVQARTWAVHPLVVVGGEAEPAWLTVFSEELRNWHPPFEIVSAKSACGTDEACLAKLARDLQSEASLMISISPYSPKLVVASRAVLQSGYVFDQHSVELSKTNAEVDPELFRKALRQVLASIRTEIPAAFVVTPKQKKSWCSTVCLVAGASLGVAVVTAAASGIVALSASQDSRQLSRLLDANGNLPAGDVVARDLQATIQAKSSASTGLLVGAGFAGAAALTFFLVDRAQPSVAVAPTNGGAHFAFSGSF